MIMGNRSVMSKRNQTMEPIVDAKFSVGQLVRHRLFNYRGVIVGADPSFSGSDEWYDQMTVTQPPKNQPWYHVLTHDSEQETYVAERNLLADDSGEPIRHPLVDNFFDRFQNGRYYVGQLH